MIVFSPFSCNHSRGGATFNGIRRDGFFLSRHKILVVVEAGEKTKKLGRTWRTNRSNYQRRSVIQQEELATVKEISQAWLAMVDDQCCIKYEGRKEKQIRYWPFIDMYAQMDGNRKYQSSKKIRKLETQLIILTKDGLTGNDINRHVPSDFRTKLFPKHQKLVQFSQLLQFCYLFRILKSIARAC